MSYEFPNGFLWGASTAAHQIEGNNVGSDNWEFEHSADTPVEEPSGDACDSLHRWPDDLDIVHELGLNSYRFSIEWARIEPEPGRISLAMLQHYRNIIEGCFERGLTPIVTLHHFTAPRWFAAEGGWRSAQAPSHFAHYVKSVLPILDGVKWVCTINEPNVLALVSTLRERGLSMEQLVSNPNGLKGALTPELLGDLQATTQGLISAHDVAQEQFNSLSDVRAGWSVAHLVVEARPGADDLAAILNEVFVDQFLRVATQDNFIGVQAYSRFVVGEEPPGEAEPIRRTLMGYEFHPEALGKAVRQTASTLPGTPIMVTENGIATASDDERIEFIDGALRGLHAAIGDGIEVLGYLHWSLLDNYEWGTYKPTFGLVAIDRSTFARTIKPSAYWYGKVAAANVLPG
jgi:beta-glucosidase